MKFGRAFAVGGFATGVPVPAPRPPPEVIQFLQLTKVRQVHIDSTSPKYHTARVDKGESVSSVVSVMRKSYAGAVLVTDGADGEFSVPEKRGNS
jgi:hypothetical protein